MAVLRINKTKDYTVMSNYHFKEKEMSLKAKGLLSQMLSLPDTWDYSIAGLVAINRENETSIKNTLRELQKFKYLKITKLMPNETKTGRIEYVYDIYEQPYQKQEVEKQEVENLGVEFLAVENQGQLNTKQLNTNELNINDKKERKKKTSVYDEIINELVTDNDIKNSIYEFIKMRKLIKKPMTDRALTMLINKLNKLSTNKEIQIKILEQSILKNWTDIYEYKEVNNAGNIRQSNKSNGSKYAQFS